MREEWEFRRRNLPTISTPMIDRIIAASAAPGRSRGQGLRRRRRRLRGPAGRARSSRPCGVGDRADRRDGASDNILTAKAWSSGGMSSACQLTEAGQPRRIDPFAVSGMGVQCSAA